MKMKGEKISMSDPVELSIVIPVYNSERTLGQLIDRINICTENFLNKRDFEIILVNDGSADSSWEIIKKNAQKNDNITGVNLTRNFGQHNALMSGFNYCHGKYVVTLDDDLQNPPEEISKLYDLIKKKHDVVYGSPIEKKHSKFRNLGSEFVQFVFRRTFGIAVRLTSFRIIKKEIVDLILSYEKSYTFIDGVIAWYTKDIGSVPVQHIERMEGKSGYSLKKLFVLTLNMVTNFSIVPVQIVSAMGLIFAITSFAFGIFFLIKKVFFGIPVLGFASLIVLVTMLSGVQLISLGMLGEYIGRMHINISNRPQYAVREMISNRKIKQKDE